MAANCWLPDGLLYIIPLFSKMWGNKHGLWLQTWAKQNHVPLIWADGDDSGMLIDPIVGQVDSPTISSAMVDAWNDRWKSGGTFAELFAASDEALQFRLPSFFEWHLCEDAERQGVNVMGSTASGECAYWKPGSLSLTFECLNDGTCASGYGASRGKYYDKDTCEANCGQAKWQCMQNKVLDGCAGDHARTCVPNPTGACDNLSDCETQCYT